MNARTRTFDAIERQELSAILGRPIEGEYMILTSDELEEHQAAINGVFMRSSVRRRQEAVQQQRLGAL